MKQPSSRANFRAVAVKPGRRGLHDTSVPPTSYDSASAFFANRASDGKLEWALNLETEPSVHKEIPVTDETTSSSTGVRLREFPFDDLTQASEWAANEALDGRKTRMRLGYKEVSSTYEDAEGAIPATS
ncbi:hypothetical protein [Nocardia abscessus]|uniref:hypothetical protein n=1 Tax=Nocardia abscessus TaxID=120957 RepID=UPI0024590143|nr:hypothetical protein [Nocardia abscessus]